MKKNYPALILLAILTGCSMDESIAPDSSGYPLEVSAIINNKCSTTGCHTTFSSAAAGGLAMETWDQLFEGSNNGAAAIAFRPDQSWIIGYTNTDSSKGPILTPRMPYNDEPLSAIEWQTLYDWVSAGAPNAQGTVPFSGDVNRKKFYVSNQGCDLISVFDADSKVCMRAIDVGQNPGAGDVPHQIRVSNDGQYWYCVFVNGTVIQKYSAADDSYLGSVDIGTGNWNTMALTPDGKSAFAVDWSDAGKIAFADMENLKFNQYYQGFAYPHGSVINPAGNILYVTSQSGNYIYKIDISIPVNPQVEQVVLVPGQSANNFPGIEDPHDIIFSEDGKQYFVTCQASNKVRVMDANTDTLVSAVSVSQFPLEMAISAQYNLLFVTCEYEPGAQPKTLGAVSIIDLNTLLVLKTLQDGLYEPHGVGVMDEEGYVVVSSRNLDIIGPAPHHVSDCGGRNGFLKLIDLNTLEFIPDFKSEVSVDPYSIAVRY
ncbi:MAG: YncE family protein [Chitinophagales bacterium]